MPNTPAQDDEALQRICKDEAASHFFDLTPGSITANVLADSIEEYAKAVARRYAATVGVGVPEEVGKAFEAAKLQELFVDGDKADVYTKPPGSSFVNEFEMVARCACGELWQRRAVAIAVGLNWIGQRIAAEHEKPHRG